MARINDLTTFPNTTPALDDHVLGTDVSNTSKSADGESVTFKFEDIRNLFGDFNKDRTWTDVSGSRTVGTSYQNTTGATMQVAFSASAEETNASDIPVDLSLQVSTDSSNWTTLLISDTKAQVYFVATADIPDDNYYRVVQGGGVGSTTVNTWLELS